MILKTAGKILTAFFAATLVLALPGVAIAYAADNGSDAIMLSADGDAAALNNLNLANTPSGEQNAAIAARGKAFIIMAAVVAVLAVGFIVVFNIQKASR